MHNTEIDSNFKGTENRFKDLKNLLMSDELREVDQKLKFLETNLETKTSDASTQEAFDKFLVSTFEEQLKKNPERFVKIFEPYFLDMLSSAAQKSDKKMIEILSSYSTESIVLSKKTSELKVKDFASEIVPMAFDSGSVSDNNKILSERLAPYIGKALKSQIQNEKETIIDVLYPIIGSLISKFIKKAFVDLNEKINMQVESALPFAVVKRKIKSKIYGISESEILFQERIQGQIKSIYLIHKATGVVISSAHAEQSESVQEGGDSLIGGMFSAITSFVNDWIENGQEQAELSEINYGDSKIFFEFSGSLITAVVLEGKLSYYLRANIQKFMVTLVSEHQDFISDFDGNIESVPVAIKNKIKTTMSLGASLQDEEGLQTKKKYLFGVAATILILVLLIHHFML